MSCNIPEGISSLERQPYNRSLGLLSESNSHPPPLSLSIFELYDRPPT